MGVDDYLSRWLYARGKRIELMNLVGDAWRMAELFYNEGKVQQWQSSLDLIVGASLDLLDIRDGVKGRELTVIRQ